MPKKPFKTVKATSQQGITFELHKGIAIELNSYNPYIFTRTAAESAIRGVSDTLLFNIGTTQITEDPAVVTIEQDSIKFGCQIWTGLDAKKLRRWAVNH
jgi:hypothetical protein